MAAAKRVLITGASGLLGRALCKEFGKNVMWETCGLSFSRSGDGLTQIDIRDKDALTQVIKDFKPSVIIHSAAERKPDVVEKQPETTYKLNVEATSNLCDIAGSVGAWVLYISTDYVFDGKNPPYKETAQPNPLNKYGQSKLDGEIATLEASQDNGVLRVPILYGEVENLSESAVTVLFDKVKDTTQHCIMSDYERRYPTYCGDIAFVIKQLAEKRIKGEKIGGIYHWSGNENMTKYDMAVAMAKAFGLPIEHIVADKSPSGGASRPYDAHLDCGRIESLGIVKRTAFNELIKDILQPHY
ncbi:hypothetical protein CHS0354_040066 [Potamilus streckersoni]|uniref:Methionine adenosyltransferase 2 subunit beta n=1 Tax=Potamilus streckersoni TaxID=2493646 RepID=A0AAE0W177_9BIVA|nr:hypothetical protein CHS0354_040066 [Potamilus streckersoni]